tara:strand:+ start:721 stop:831 length:111 start_codon:yes stop_codon:yes gene_type:complete
MFHFNKNKEVAAPGDQINLTARQAQITGKNMIKIQP